MNIMFEDSITDEVKSKYMLLELDTFYFSGIDKQKTSFCLIEPVSISELLNIEKNLELHKNFIKNYKLRNWKYCEDALEHLIGKWNGEVDSFYNEINSRVKLHKNQEPNTSWDGTIHKD